MPSGVPWVSKIQKTKLKASVVSRSAKIWPKLNKIQKTFRKQGFFDNFCSILTTIFHSFFNFGWILVLQLTRVDFSLVVRIFWHPWHPWGRLSSGDIWVFRFVFNILLQWRHLPEIFIFIKMISHVTFIILANQIVILSLLIPTKLTITKIHHLIRLRFEQSEHKKSQCD